MIAMRNRTPDISRRPALGALWVAAAILTLGAGSVRPSDWAAWRGPSQDGFSADTGLISSWSPAGENLIWKAAFIGRSTPVVLHGQVCVIGRVGEGIDRQEVVACYDAETGRKQWEHRFNVYHTTVPFNRVGWASLAGDTETGNIYAHGVGGQLFCYDRDGKILWSYHLTERFGRASGYGGRTQTPLVYGDLLILSFVSVGWGDQAAPRHRYFAFDKHSGDLIWVATPGGRPYDMNTQSVPVTATIGKRPLLVAGNADGSVYAMDLTDGSKVWGFQLSKRGLNSSVLVHGDWVYASHSEENLDAATMGRVVCFKGTGSGDITGTNEIWRADISAGFPSPALHGCVLYVVDNSANLYALDATTGATRWKHNVGKVGKGSPVVADGKIYVAEVNGLFHILRPGKDGCEVLSTANLTVADGRYAEVYGSPAVAYGRIYFTTEAGLYCLGKKNVRFPLPEGPKKARPAGRPASGSLLVVPADAMVAPGSAQQFRVAELSANGRLVDVAQPQWTVDGLQGSIDSGGLFTASDAGAQTGAIRARLGSLSGASRVRVVPGLPYVNDFDSLPAGKPPVSWIGAGSKFVGGELDGAKVLVQPVRARGLQRSLTYFGWSDWSDDTIQVDVRGTQAGRRRPDIGMIAGGYILDLQGNHQRLEVRSWTAELRMARQVDFAWEMDTWYRMKLRVQGSGDKAIIRGKVWKVGEDEPAAWSITAEDPLPISNGCAGLVGYAPAEIYYDNLEVR